MGWLDSDKAVDLGDAFKSLFEDDDDTPTGTESSDDSGAFDPWGLWGSDDTATEEDLFGEGWEEEATAEDSEESIAGWASRQTTDSETQTVLDCGYELRKIILCNGIQYTRNSSERALQEHELLASMSGQSEADRRAYSEAIGRRRSCIVPDGLQLSAENGEYRRINDFEFEYRNDLQKVLYKVLIRETKDAFIEALQTPDVMVVYSGHARYGRGPCFGLNPMAGEDWEMGQDRARGGIFRMGYPIVAVHASEIAQHGYSYYPVSTDDFPPNEGVPHSLLHPDIHALKVWRDKLPKSIASKALSQSPYGDTESFSTDKEVYVIPASDPEILIWAGWSDSIGSPHELGQVDLQCKALMLFACSTVVHWKKILRDKKGWQKSGDDRFAFFTSDVSDSMLDKFWFEGLLNYDQDNAHQGWEKALKYAQDESNKRLKASGETYRVVT